MCFYNSSVVADDYQSVYIHSAVTRAEMVYIVCPVLLEL
jgi:hypothetical protein